MIRTCRHSNRRSSVLDIAFNHYRLKLGIKIFSDPFQSHVLTVLLLRYQLAHLIDFPYIGIVQFHKMSVDERKADHSEVKIPIFLQFVFKSSLICIFKTSRLISNYWPYRTCCILLPYSKTPRQLSTRYYDVIIYRKIYESFTLLRCFKTPV